MDKWDERGLSEGEGNSLNEKGRGRNGVMRRTMKERE